MNEFIYAPPQKKKLFDRFFFVYSILFLVVLVLQTLIITFFVKNSPEKGSDSDATWYKETANKLNSVGLSEIAADNYADYLRKADIEPDKRAGIAFSVGKLYLDAKKYEKALQWFYLVEIFDSKTTLKEEVGTKIVHCLEQLKKFNAAEYTLTSRTKRGANPDDIKGSKVVAEIGSDKISVRDIDDAINELPEWYRQNFSSKEKKTEFLEKYVADELLYRKAMKLEYDKKPAIRDKVDKFIKAAIVQAIMEDEVMAKVKPSEKDVETYFQANKAKYDEKEKVEVGYIKLKNRGDAETVRKELKPETLESIAGKHSKDKNFKIWLDKGSNPLQIKAFEKDEAKIFALEKFKASEPVLSGEETYLFIVLDKKAASQAEYSKVKEKVKQDFAQEKMQEAYQNLITETLSVSEVKLHPEVFNDEK